MLGQANERALFRSVFKHIKKYEGASEAETIGHDYAVSELSGVGLISASACGKRPEYAWNMAMNRFLMSGGRPDGVRLTLMLPETAREQDLKTVMQSLCCLAEGDHVQILAADTFVTGGVLSEGVTVFGSGIPKLGVRKIVPGDQVVQVGYSGYLATGIFYREKKRELSESLNGDFVTGALLKTEAISVLPAVRKTLESGIPVHALKSVGFGGVFGALWQLGLAANKGVTADWRAIPILQETVEAAELFGINPYRMHGGGAFFAVTPEGKTLCEHLQRAGFVASVIGEITGGNDRKLKEPERFLTSVEEDELYRVPGVEL